MASFLLLFFPPLSLSLSLSVSLSLSFSLSRKEPYKNETTDCYGGENDEDQTFTVASALDNCLRVFLSL